MASQMLLLSCIVIDIVILAIGTLASLYLELYGIAYKRGFFCDDDSIRYPFKSPLFSETSMYFTFLLIPFVMICLNEFCEHLRKKNYSQQRLLLCSWPVPSLLVSLYCRTGAFLFGVAICVIVLDVTKLSVGRLRPFFLDVCKPSINCTAYSHSHTYITNYVCTGDNLQLIEHARESFPSGHALVMVYSMVYLILYSHNCVHIQLGNLLKHALQFVLALFAWYIALSRIFDDMHHWDDVMGGMIMGGFAAVAVVCFVSDIPLKKTEDEDSTLCDSAIGVPSTGYQTLS